MNTVNTMNNHLINIINMRGIISGMMTKSQIYGVMYYLSEVLNNKLEGNIVELGCNIGTTSIFIREILNIYNSNKEFHVYDSWEGLPKKLEQDIGLGNRQFYKGGCRTTKQSFINTFNNYNLKLPSIHSGWFKEINDQEYPDKICFAFLDGDFYSSIIDSLNKVYHKMVKGGIIIIDDCGWDALPGCKQAVEDFFER